MVGFLGSHLHSIDAKGRVSLPAQFRRGHESEPFILIHVQPDALSLLPEESWAELQRELREMARREPGFRGNLLSITALASEVTPDKQGRILIPDRLREAVGLGSEALIVGAIDKIEIWEPARFERSTSVVSEEFDRFIRKIFA